MNTKSKAVLYGIIALLLVILLFFTLTLLTSCGNKSIFDTKFTFNYAYVAWPDGSSEKLEIRSWKDYDGEQIQITTTDGKTYVFSSYNCVLGTD